jgi:hypothetical protein
VRVAAFSYGWKTIPLPPHTFQIILAARRMNLGRKVHQNRPFRVKRGCAMLWALGQPAALVGLLIAFLLALVIRHTAQHLTEWVLNWSTSHYPNEHITQRPHWFNLKRDVDPFGAVAVAIAGVGWGRSPSVRRRISVIAGPLAVFIAAQLVFLSYRLSSQPRSSLDLLTSTDVLHGAPGEVSEQLLLSIAVGLLAFAIFALVPLPPLDGWTLLRHNKPASKASYWLAEQNIGVAILLGSLLLPILNGTPPALYLLDLIVTPIMRAWA